MDAVGPEPAMLGHEAIEIARDLGDHRGVDFRRDRVSAMALGEGHHADRQRDPGLDLRQRRAAPARRRAVEANQLRGAAADVEQDHAIRLRIEQRRAAGGRQRRFGLAVDDVELEPDLGGDAARNSAPFSAERQASVAISRARVTPRLRILSRQMESASTARTIAASHMRPDVDTPSPSRMMREKASTTRKLSPVGRATRSRQLLVPRSSAA